MEHRVKGLCSVWFAESVSLLIHPCGYRRERPSLAKNMQMKRTIRGNLTTAQSFPFWKDYLYYEEHITGGNMAAQPYCHACVYFWLLIALCHLQPTQVGGTLIFEKRQTCLLHPVQSVVPERRKERKRKSEGMTLVRPHLCKV